MLMWGCSLVVKYLPTKLKVPGSIVGPGSVPVQCVKFEFA